MTLMSLLALDVAGKVKSATSLLLEGNGKRMAREVRGMKTKSLMTTLHGTRGSRRKGILL